MNNKLLFSTIVLFTLYRAFTVNSEINNCNFTVNLSSSGIYNLGGNFINSNCVKNLILHENNISKLNKDFFDNYPHLEFLDLSTNRLKLNEFFSLCELSNLKVLILDNNYIESEWETSNKIDHYDDNENNFTDIKNNTSKLFVLNKFPELTHLSIRNVHLNSFSENWLDRFPKLKFLDLSGNVIDEAALSLLFRNISASITDIVLENVGLTIVRSEQMNAIESMRLDHNYIPKLTSRKCYEKILCLENMDNLKVLSLSNCSVRFIDDNAFRYIKNLIELDLSNNNLRQIPDKMFSHVVELENLNLSGNPLLSMPSINLLKNLTSLSMDRMKAKKLFATFSISMILPRLKYFSMQENELSSVPSSWFDNLPILEILDLSNNRLTSLPSWESQKSLRQLNLNSNCIERLDNLELKNAKLLDLLALKNNSISKIKISFLKNLPNSDVVLDL